MNTVFSWVFVANTLGWPNLDCGDPPPKIELLVPKVCALCPVLNVEVLELVAPNIELVLVALPKLPKLLAKLGVPPNTGLEPVAGLPNIEALL